MNKAEYLKRLYENRFDSQQQRSKLLLWNVLIQDFLQKYVSTDAVVLDIAGGYCEFINQISASSKHLIDLNPDCHLFANPNVDIMNIDILDIHQREKVENNFFDIIFVSNFFEHLADQDQLFEVLDFCFQKLKPGGSLLVIQPNFKYSYREYFDFIDHYLPITHQSLLEVLKALDFRIDTLIPRFLPFSTKGRPSAAWMLRLYLKLPIAWKLLGGQMFVQASKPYSPRQ
ncbi:MAG: class I SAM-dependent methyltransferase [Leptolyngbya sp. SIOISBB]|nr:class I SAM-dependent methyltransferase [Leptolyngbya sp. SIOISBB]